MNIQFEKVYERDVDLLVIEAFSNKKSICNLFFEKLDIKGLSIEKIEHSATDLHGESDIVVTLNGDNKTYLILIENKINAQAQPFQYERYVERGEFSRENGNIDDYYIFIIAPKEYLKSNKMAQKYPYRISYEEMLDEAKLEDDIYAISILEKALEKGHEIAVDENVTKFWLEYYRYQETYYPSLELHKNNVRRPSGSTWPEFKTVLKKSKIIHKSEKGYVDLEFAGMSEYLDKLSKLLYNYKDKNMHWRETGKSVSLGIDVGKICFSEPFTKYEKKEIPFAFKAVNRLNELAIKIQDMGLLDSMHQEEKDEI